MKNLDYNSALAELDEIIQKIENNQVPIDEFQKIIDRAKYLFEFCQNKLRQAQDTLNDAFNEKKNL